MTPGCQIIQGDCLSVLRGMEAESVHCVVTSPPYWGLRDYGIEPSIWGGDPGCVHAWGESVEQHATNHTDKRRWNHARNGRGEEQPTEKLPGWKRQKINQGEFCHSCGAWRGVYGLEPDFRLYLDHTIAIFREVRRVLRSDGTLWLNIGDCYATGAGKVGEHPGGGQRGAAWKGNRGTRPGSPKHACGAMGPMTQPNRMPQPGLKPKDLCMMPARVAIALQEDGWYLRSDIIWSKPNPMPESVRDRPTNAHEHLFLLSKRPSYFYDAEAIREPSQVWTGRAAVFERDGAVADHVIPGQGYAEHRRGRSRTNGKWSGNDSQSSGLRMVDSVKTARANGAAHDSPFGAGRNRRSVWEIATAPYPEAHFATFPLDLVKPCILAATSDCGVCPKCGAPWERMIQRSGGTTGRGWHDHSVDAQQGQRLPGNSGGIGTKEGKAGKPYRVESIGWRPTCAHELERIPAVILDPFTGSGTTGVVALQYGRSFIGIELNPAYVELAERRLAPHRAQGRLDIA